MPRRVVGGMDNQLNLDRIRFLRDCAADWRRRAAAMQLAEAKEDCLDFAIYWDELATQLQSEPAIIIDLNTEQPQTPKAVG